MTSYKQEHEMFRLGQDTNCHILVAMVPVSALLSAWKRPSKRQQ
jgi:hypothetical protein